MRLTLTYNNRTRTCRSPPTVAAMITVASDLLLILTRWKLRPCSHVPFFAPFFLHFKMGWMHSHGGVHT